MQVPYCLRAPYTYPFSDSRMSTTARRFALRCCSLKYLLGGLNFIVLMAPLEVLPYLE